MMASQLSGLSRLFARNLCLSRGSVGLSSQTRTPGKVWSCQNVWAKNENSLQQISGLPLCFVQSQRFYNRKKTIKIPPTKPLSFDYSGDRDYTLPPIDENSPKYGFDGVDELKSADPVVQSIFSIKFADRQNVLAQQIKELLEKIQEHPADLRSLEVNIARDTLRLRNQIHHVKQFRKDKICKKTLIERIHRRNKFLRILRSRDMEKFEWLLEELKIKYIPLKASYKSKNLSRRATRKKVARDGFFTAKKEKLLKLEKTLAEEREKFEVEREEEMSRIKEELKDLGIHEMESVESVIKALDMEQYLEKKELRMKRRYLILGQKFERWEENQKKAKLET